MFQNMNPLNRDTATLEILLMLAGAFVLGYLWRWWQINQTNAKLSSSPVSQAGSSDDLKIVEGIGPKIEEAMNMAGIYNFKQLAATDVVRIKEILTRAGGKFKVADPTTWVKQAELARDGKWDELQKLQKKLTAGRA